MLRFAATGPSFRGPAEGIATSLTATVGEPLTLVAWVNDEGAKINIPPPFPRRESPSGAPPAPTGPPAPSLKWSVFRGPGAVTFDPCNPKADMAQNGRSSTTATFAAPGEYILRLQANDSTGEGGGGFQCCWTNTHVKVTIKGPTSG